MTSVSLPENLGRLRKVERIGAGGFATVWLFHDDELDSPVAVKALADNWAQRTDIRDRFVEEARILRHADSDHVVRVYDIGQHEGTPYFVMTYADRGTVADMLDQHHEIGTGLVLDLLDQAATGLDVLHRQGVIHRDVKPQNLLLREGRDGKLRLMVADLGMAKAELHASGLTQVVGTPAYMAPEQATMVGLSTRADTYALAAVAYRLLTGRPVREGGLADVIDMTPVPAPSAISDLPQDADAVFADALASEPTQRPSPREFVRQLRVALAPTLDDPVPPAPHPPAPRPLADLEPTGYDDLPSRRGPLVPILVALLVFAVCFAAAYVITGQVR